MIEPSNLKNFLVLFLAVEIIFALVCNDYFDCCRPFRNFCSFGAITAAQ